MESKQYHYIDGSSELSDLINFDKYFPKLVQALTRVPEVTGFANFGTKENDVRNFIKQEKEHLLPIFQAELEQVLPYDYWKTLFSYSDSFISVHTINVLYRVISDPLY